MTEVIEQQHDIEDGDVFRWRYRDEKRNSDYLNYWAKSCIAIAQNGRLRDTFWTSGDGATWSYEDAAAQLVLTYLGNLVELEQKPEYFADYYDDADCLNLNHSNSSKGNFYIRKGAKRSPEKMLQTAHYLLDKAEHKVQSALRDVERFSTTIGEIKAGKNLDEVYL